MTNHPPPPQFIDSLFFKEYPALRIPPGSSSELSKPLAVSHKYGLLFFTVRNKLTILPASNLLSSIHQADKHRKLELSALPHLTVEHMELPTVIALSYKEEWIALGLGSSLMIYNLQEFLSTKGRCEEWGSMRGSSGSQKISEIVWNPSLDNILGVLSDDGKLLCATIKERNRLELFSYGGGLVRSLCWSPKGKQLVVGREDGKIVQLKMDMKEAKVIDGHKGKVASAIYWTATTQFLINFTDGETFDFMQVDLVKGAPPVYTPFYDIFVSDKVELGSKCFFSPILPWNIILCTSSTTNDVIVLVKGKKEGWTTADLDDKGRAAIPIDNYAAGAALYYAYDGVVAEGNEQFYRGMPVLFVLSQGLLSSFVLINKSTDAAVVAQNVEAPLPLDYFGQPQQEKQPQESPALAAPITPVTLLPAPPPPPLSTLSPSLFQLPSFDVKPSLGIGGGGGLPTLEQVGDLKKMVEEKRAAQGFHDKEHEDEPDMDEMLLEVEKFQTKLQMYYKRKESSLPPQDPQAVHSSCVVPQLGVMEEFVSTLESTVSLQKEEVVALKERTFSHYSTLEYAKALGERNADPKYQQLLASQPLDSERERKFGEVEKLHGYVKSQLEECHKYFQNRNLPGPPATLHSIYQILSTHSKIIQRLLDTINGLRMEIGMSKMSLSVPFHTYEIPLMAHHYYSPNTTTTHAPPTSLLKERTNPGAGMNKSSSSSGGIPKFRGLGDTSNKLTLDDITSGLSGLKLRKLKELEGARYEGMVDSKPLKITAHKLQVLKNLCKEPVEVKVEDHALYDVGKQGGRTRSRQLIDKLDDTVMPKATKPTPTAATTAAAALPKTPISTAAPIISFGPSTTKTTTTKIMSTAAMTTTKTMSTAATTTTKTMSAATTKTVSTTTTTTTVVSLNASQATTPRPTVQLSFAPSTSISLGGTSTMSTSTMSTSIGFGKPISFGAPTNPATPPRMLFVPEASTSNPPPTPTLQLAPVMSTGALATTTASAAPIVQPPKNVSPKPSFLSAAPPTAFVPVDPPIPTTTSAAPLLVPSLLPPAVSASTPPDPPPPPASSTSSPFGAAPAFSTPSTTSLFGAAFGAALSGVGTSGSGGGIFGGNTSGTVASSFGLFAQPSATTPSAFNSSGSSLFSSPAPKQESPSSGGVQQAAAAAATPLVSGITGAAAAPTPSAFGSVINAPVAPAPSVFGPSTTSSFSFAAAPVFGSPSTGGPTPAFSTTGNSSSIFGSAGGGSIFGGSSGVVGGGTPSFGALAQQQSSSAFGGSSPFASSPPPNQSPFGGQATGAFGGASSTAFGSPATATAPIFGASTNSNFSFGSAPVFGSGTPAFSTGGSTSPFGSAFGSSGVSGLGSGSIFGGNSGGSTSFGALAQSSATSSSFGSPFGAPAPNQSPFGGQQLGGGGAPLLSSPPTSPLQQQQQSLPSFGGSSFSSWR